jgi:2-desacetyl-2-hydroxyethyl bacteriochlorophyllide A dehydrogenase
MRTLILENPGKFRLTETYAPTNIDAGDALVRVRAIGICGTDLHAYRGRQPFFTYPRILGHELGVEIVEVGPNEFGLQAGDRCAVEPYLNCGHCIACRAGKTNCCASLQCLGVHCDGGMRELMTVPARKLHKSDMLSFDQLALVETLGIGAHAVQRARLEPGETCLVVGAGPIGLSVIQFALIAGAKVIVLDFSARRLEFCRDHLGVATTIEVGIGIDTQQWLKDLTNGDMPTAVFDATGNSQSMMRSFDFAASGGRLIMVGLYQGDYTFSDPEFHRRELTLLATRNSTAADFKRIIGLLEEGAIDIVPWVTHRARGADIASQFVDWLSPETGVIKAIVEI